MLKKWSDDYENLNLMDGEITVRSEIGAGSVFTINLTFNESIKIDPKKKLVGKIA